MEMLKRRDGTTVEPQPQPKPAPQPARDPAPVSVNVSAAAAVLGRKAKGVKKSFSPEELEKRRQRMLGINEARRTATASGKKTVKVHVARGMVRRTDPRVRP